MRHRARSEGADRFAKDNCHRSVPRPICCSFPVVTRTRALSARRFAGSALKIKADPVMRRVALCLENHRRTGEILNDDVEPAAIEEISHSQSTAHLREPQQSRSAHLRSRMCHLAGSGIRSLGSRYAVPSFRVIDLGIDMAVDQNQIQPARIVEVEEGIAPADEGTVERAMPANERRRRSSSLRHCDRAWHIRR